MSPSTGLTDPPTGVTGAVLAPTTVIDVGGVLTCANVASGLVFRLICTNVGEGVVLETTHD